MAETNQNTPNDTPPGRKTNIWNVAFSSIILSGEDKLLEGENGITYTVHTNADSFIGEGSQAVVTHAEGSDGAGYAAKIAYRINDPMERLTHKEIVDYLKDLTLHPKSELDTFHRTHLMPIFASGYVEDSVEDLGESDYEVAIMPLCDNTLSLRTDISYEEIRDTILPQAAEALKTLHGQGIVHRDMKPHNLYYLDGEIVLGDFGISSKLTEDERVSYTKMNRGTDGYNPDNSVVCIENDWYALGYTLWTFYNGSRHPHQELLDTGGIATVLAGNRPVKFNAREPEHEALGRLIMGLTYYRPELRLGYEDIQRWLADPQAFTYEDPRGIGSSHDPYQFDNESLNSLEEIGNALLQKWDMGKERLYNESLQHYFAKIGQDDLYSNLNALVHNNEFTQSNQDAGLSRAISLILADKVNIYWKGQAASIDRLGDLLEALGKDEGLTLLKTGVPAWIAESACGGSSTVCKQLEALIGDAQALPDFAYTYAVDAFRPNETAGKDSLRSLSHELLEDPAFFMQQLSKTNWLLKQLGALAASTGQFDACRTAAETIVFGSQDGGEADRSLDETSARRAWQLLFLLESIAETERDQETLSLIRNFALNWSPLGFINWIVEHQSEYKAQNADGKNALKKIDTSIPQSSVADIRKALSDLTPAIFDLQDHTLASPYLYELDLATADDWIIPSSADGYFTSAAYGREVPRGYILELLGQVKGNEESRAWIRETLLGAYNEKLEAEAALAAEQAAQRLTEKKNAHTTIGNWIGDIAQSVGALIFAVFAIQVISEIVGDFAGSFITLSDNVAVPTEGIYGFLAIVAVLAILVATSMFIARRMTETVAVLSTKTKSKKLTEQIKLLNDHATRLREGTDTVRPWVISTNAGNPPQVLKLNSVMFGDGKTVALLEGRFKPFFWLGCITFVLSIAAMFVISLAIEGDYIGGCISLAICIAVFIAAVKFFEDSDNILKFIALCVAPLLVFFMGLSNFVWGVIAIVVLIVVVLLFF